MVLLGFQRKKRKKTHFTCVFHEEGHDSNGIQDVLRSIITSLSIGKQKSSFFEGERCKSNKGVAVTARSSLALLQKYASYKHEGCFDSHFKWFAASDVEDAFLFGNENSLVFYNFINGVVGNFSSPRNYFHTRSYTWEEDNWCGDIFNASTTIAVTQVETKYEGNITYGNGKHLLIFHSNIEMDCDPLFPLIIHSWWESTWEEGNCDGGCFSAHSSSFFHSNIEMDGAPLINLQSRWAFTWEEMYGGCFSAHTSTLIHGEATQVEFNLVNAVTTARFHERIIERRNNRLGEIYPLQQILDFVESGAVTTSTQLQHATFKGHWKDSADYLQTCPRQMICVENLQGKLTDQTLPTKVRSDLLQKILQIQNFLILGRVILALKLYNGEAVAKVKLEAKQHLRTDFNNSAQIILEYIDKQKKFWPEENKQKKKVKNSQALLRLRQFTWGLWYPVMISYLKQHMVRKQVARFEAMGLLIVLQEEKENEEFVNFTMGNASTGREISVEEEEENLEDATVARERWTDSPGQQRPFTRSPTRFL